MTERDYALCGWRVRSVLPLPELALWTGPDEAAVDVWINAGALPAVPASAPWLAVDSQGSVRLRIPDLAQFLIEGGRRITVDILGQETAPAWRLFLLGMAIGVLCHQRATFPLHAASLSIGGRTVALLGASGAGKSTLALALLRRGHHLLSDDLTVLDPANRTVLPSFCRLKVWRDTLEAMGEDMTGLQRVRDALEKYDLPPRQDFDTSPRRLEGVLLLARGKAPERIAVPATAAVPLILSHVSRPSVGRMLGRQADLFRAAGGLAGTVPVTRLIRSLDYADLGETVGLVEDFMDRG